jgi:spore maturation protein CgeB
MPLYDSKIFSENLKALSENGQTELVQWLQSQDPAEGVTYFQSQDGSAVLVVQGQTQDSRFCTKREAKALVAKSLSPYTRGAQVWLFGFSSPQTVLAALEVCEYLTIYEPDPIVAKAALSLLNLQNHISNGQLRLLGPWALSKGETPPLAPLLIIHPASQRREKTAYLGLCRYLKGPKTLSLDSQGRARILIIPPFSGGSLAMGGYLYKAAQELEHQALLLTWPAQLAIQAQCLKETGSGSAQNIFSLAADFAAQTALDFKADLILCLAQAPLDAANVARVSECTGAVTAFWFVEDYQRFSYVKDVAPAYDMFFHIQGDLLGPVVKDWGLSKCWYLPLAADESVFFPQSVPQIYQSTLSFLGALYPNRRQLLAQVAQFWQQTGGKTEQFQIFGASLEFAPEPIKPHIFQGGRRIEPQECPLVYAGSQINLNIHSSDRDGFEPDSAFVNPRTFEVACAEGFQIVDKRPLMDGLFSGEELSQVAAPGELIPTISEYLKEPEKRRAIAKAARKRVLKEHLYTHRLSFILQMAAI